MRFQSGIRRLRDTAPAHDSYTANGPSGDVSVIELLDDLERLLVELAASPDHVSHADFERVRQRIAAKDLLFKLRIVSDGVRERQTQQIRARAGQSS